MQSTSTGCSLPSHLAYLDCVFSLSFSLTHLYIELAKSLVKLTRVVQSDDWPPHGLAIFSAHCSWMLMVAPFSCSWLLRLPFDPSRFSSCPGFPAAAYGPVAAAAVAAARGSGRGACGRGGYMAYPQNAGAGKSSVGILCGCTSPSHSLIFLMLIFGETCQ